MAFIDDTPQLVGGRLALDFVNTATWAGDVLLLERLVETRDAFVWARAAGLAALDEAAVFSSRTGPADLPRLRDLRAAIRRLVRVAGSPTRASGPIQALATIEGALAEAHLQPSGSSRRSAIRVGNGDGAWDRIGPAAALSAAALLAAPDHAHVRECQGRQCGWVFIDTGRARPRRWCSMAACGNREKARRHHARTRTA